jgi:hypothetical protein
MLGVARQALWAARNNGENKIGKGNTGNNA